MSSSGPAPIVVAEEPDDTPRVAEESAGIVSVEESEPADNGTSYPPPPPPPNLNSASPPNSRPPPPIRVAASEAAHGQEPSSDDEEGEDALFRNGGGGSPGSDRLDESTTRYVKGDGILASIKDVSVAPTEFAEGCKLLQACALGDRTRVEALLRINKGHINFRD